MRIVSFLALLISFLFPVFAVDDERNPSIMVVLDNTSGDGSYEIGFSTNSIDNLVDEPSVAGNQELTAKPGEFIARNESVYFYWKLISEQKIEFSLSIGDLGNSGIDWRIYWNRDIAAGINDGEISTEQGKVRNTPIYTYDPSDASSDPAHSILLRAETESIEGLNVESPYVGTLTATIRVVP